MIALLFIVAVVVCGLIFRATERKKIFDLTFVFLAAQVLFLPYIAFNKNVTELGIFKYDSLGILFFGVLAIIAIAVFVHSKKYLDNESVKQLRLYNMAFVALCVCITGVYFSDNVTVTWVLIEATTIASALLIYHRRTPRALEASWKYVFICSTGILIAYLGILFLSIMLKQNHGNMSFGSLGEVVSSANPLYLKLAFVFILTGYSCKMEFFPLYPIGIDANHLAPAPMSAFLSTAMVNMGFVSIFRIYRLLSDSPVFVWAQNVMLVTGIITLLVATIYIIQVRHFKRLFAYSTVENMGIVLLILSTGSKAGMVYAIFHTLMHSLVKSTAFLQLSTVGKIFRSYMPENMGGYFQISKNGSLVLILCLLGLTAIPPSALFVSEMYVFSELSKNVFILIFMLLMTCIILYFLCFKFLKIIYGKPPERKIPVSEDRLTSVVQFSLLALFFIPGIYQPQWFINLIYECLI